MRETRDAHRKEKEDERRVVVEDERTDSLIALPFRRGAPMHERARTCVYHAHPLLWMHTSRAVSTILKGSRRTFPARRNREQLTPRRLSIPFPPTLLPPFLSFHLFTLLLLPSPLPPFPRFTVETNAANTYISVCVYIYIYMYTRRAIRDRARDARARGGIRGGEDGRRRRQLEATETSCIPGH